MLHPYLKLRTAVFQYLKLSCPIEYLQLRTIEGAEQLLGGSDTAQLDSEILLCHVLDKIVRLVAYLA